MAPQDLIEPSRVIEGTLDDLGIIRKHSKESTRECAFWLENTGLNDPDLIDLTNLPFVTIDNENSRDLDQALHIERKGDGYTVFYALADASYYIRPGSALFKEALQRGATYYTPLFAAPMLPTELSEGLISLNPDVLRRALVFEIHLDVNAKVLNCEVTQAKVLSRAKLSYEGVQRWLDINAADKKDYHSGLKLLKELGEKLICAGTDRGVVGFDRSEASIVVRGSPPRFVTTRRERFDTEKYNEQISLLCNMQGAEMLLGLAGVSDVVQAVFRVHEAPLKKSLKALKTTLNELANNYPEPARWQWKSEQTLAQFVANLPDEKIHHRRVQAIQRQIMQAQRGSTFTPEPGEHHALKTCSYARFSSPMREVVGIFTHKELLEAFNGQHYNIDTDYELREAVIDAANYARQQQRKLDKKIEFAALHSCLSESSNSKQTTWHRGTLVGIRADKFYISLDELALDVKLYRSDLEQLLNTKYTVTNILAIPDNELAPRWQLGQGVQLRLQRYDDARQRFIFTIETLE